MRDDKSSYVIVGLFVVAMVAALIVWIGLVSGRSGATDPYYIEFSNVTGLNTGVEILFEGYPVGLIDEIRRADTTPIRFRVDVSLKRGWPIPEDSEAVVSSGLFSASMIDIRSGKSSGLLAPGSQIPSSDAGDALAAMGTAASSAAEMMQDLGPAVESLSDRLPEIMSNATSISEKLDITMNQLNQVLGSENVERIGSILENLDGALQEADRAVSDLGKTRAALDGVINKVDQMLEEDEGDLALAVADLRYSLATLARHMDGISANLEATMRNMNEFSRQVRDNPGVLLRGREGGDGQ